MYLYLAPSQKPLRIRKLRQHVDLAADFPHQVMTKKDTAKASEASACRKEHRLGGSWETTRGTTSHDVL